MESLKGWLPIWLYQMENKTVKSITSNHYLKVLNTAFINLIGIRGRCIYI